ncbi:MAG: DUF262 domain-containing protein [Lachnospiraceae bacterium]|nr:DUF262 domain-containing protein [Lachnospiraceae bacterium]
MKSKIYYGEYSLEDWMNMLLKNNIEIPPYQRYFVWDRESVIDLIKSFKDNKYVPTITICKSIGNDGKEHNYIVDGQQRLSAIFMYKYDFFYDTRKKIDEDSSDGDATKNCKEWTIAEIISKGKENIEKIITDEIIKNSLPYSRLLDERNEILKTDKKEYFEKTFLGFSYIILENTKDLNEQQKYYAQIFNDINTKGVSLTPIESRKAYYFINDKYKELFNINFENIDFVRYLAMLSEYYKNKDNHDDCIKIAKNTGKSRNLENYIIEYIVDMSEKESKKFTKIDEIFNNNNYRETNEIKYLTKCLKEQYYKFGENDSIIDQDVKLFGLIYVVLFLHKIVIDEQKDNLEKELNKIINDIHNDEKKRKSPRSNSYLNERLRKSIEIYEKFSK